ncbi:hypothetical protein GPY51_21370 [Photorhabdus laumondii subsp. laumondii]|uniref:Photorhabdus luminescens subsp. laumondii TTO1 complete genome segment 10/17 n=2 Tax=Photorhabdus laumondii subsp. laumondii TaxID=141679 RepID=Q7N320_PHOLL|nr:hypothetical protein [Photorhabdus laumondii]AWK42608.1 hypothetical protein A4R40_14470 [Photorhabdus laumondii subsp. laumondii]AXG47933.1 hypothetical protein PluTT01m_14890 [Photorhabdus laumondii subsp. laumondii]MCC8384954.1 hypothetical protein [Photorhabdus laumondii]MCC8413660.1 hypothetical protein [Photorhabdus laumondii]NDK96822.1 hypothetical protein [Photorhabdus laumondii subsp. laumondii]
MKPIEYLESISLYDSVARDALNAIKTGAFTEEQVIAEFMKVKALQNNALLELLEWKSLKEAKPFQATKGKGIPGTVRISYTATDEHGNETLQKEHHMLLTDVYRCRFIVFLEELKKSAKEFYETVMEGDEWDRKDTSEKSAECLIVNGKHHGKRRTLTSRAERYLVVSDDVFPCVDVDEIPVHFWVNEADGKIYMIATAEELNSSEISLAISETDPPLKPIY